MKMSETKDGIVIEVFVKPNSQKFEATVEDDEVVVRCKEEPVKGKVNKEIIKELSKLFHSRVEIVSGATSKQKVLLVRGAKKNEIERLLK
jgi:uncharacterized protein